MSGILPVAELYGGPSNLETIDRTQEVRELAAEIRHVKYKIDNMRAVLEEDASSNASNAEMLETAVGTISG